MKHADIVHLLSRAALRGALALTLTTAACGATEGDSCEPLVARFAELANAESPGVVADSELPGMTADCRAMAITPEQARCGLAARDLDDFERCGLRREPAETAATATATATATAKELP